LARGGTAPGAGCAGLPASNGASVKRPWKPPSSRPSPSKQTLEMGAARELLNTWLVIRDKDAIERHLGVMDKLYGKGAEQRIRAYMKEIYRDERHD
jgi:hypothetical protein